jgi:hypothetical protein
MTLRTRVSKCPGSRPIPSRTQACERRRDDLDLRGRPSPHAGGMAPHDPLPAGGEREMRAVRFATYRVDQVMG